MQCHMFFNELPSAWKHVQWGIVCSENTHGFQFKHQIPNNKIRWPPFFPLYLGNKNTTLHFPSSLSICVWLVFLFRCRDQLILLLKLKACIYFFSSFCWNLNWSIPFNYVLVDSWCIIHWAVTVFYDSPWGVMKCLPVGEEQTGQKRKEGGRWSGVRCWGGLMCGRTISVLLQEEWEGRRKRMRYRRSLMSSRHSPHRDK